MTAITAPITGGGSLLAGSIIYGIGGTGILLSTVAIQDLNDKEKAKFIGTLEGGIERVTNKIENNLSLAIKYKDAEPGEYTGQLGKKIIVKKGEDEGGDSKSGGSVSIIDPDGTTTTYYDDGSAEITTESGVTAKIDPDGNGSMTLPDGTIITWTYEEDGSMVIVIETTEGELITIKDGKITRSFTEEMYEKMRKKAESDKHKYGWMKLV